MLKDLRDANMDIVVMHRGTDAEHKFVPILDSGSTFVWDQYDVVCEGRVAIANEKKNFLFPVSYAPDDELNLVKVEFPKTIVTDYIRETRLYWKVIATHKVSGKSTVVKYGEIWLK